jgi:hypothetical protein
MSAHAAKGLCTSLKKPGIVILLVYPHSCTWQLTVTVAWEDTSTRNIIMVPCKSPDAAY